MSLFGTGRKEGVLAVCLIGLLTTTVHLAAASRHGLLREAGYITMIAGAIGGMLTYRFLRVQGRSRYAGFIGGIAYGMSPLFAGFVDSPREQLAAALVPLALEAVGQCERPSTRRAWLPWTGICMALPFVLGVTVVAILATTVALAMLAKTIIHSGKGFDRALLRSGLLTVAIGCLAASNLVSLDLLAGWLGEAQPVELQTVLSGQASPVIAARIAGPFLIWFAVLGVLRRQRNVATSLWLMTAIVGALPTILLTVPDMSPSISPVLTSGAVPAMSWWLSMLAFTVMGTAGLDDWLDQPQRRRGAHLWLLMATLLVAPALPLACVSIDPTHLVTVFGTIALVACATIGWRRLGIMRFKNVLSTVAIAVFAVPVILQAQPEQVAASPFGETAIRTWQRVAELPRNLDWWHLAGLSSALLAAAIFAILPSIYTAKRSR